MAQKLRLMKVWVTLVGTELQSPKVLAQEGKGNTKQVVEDSYKYPIQPLDPLDK